MTLTRVSSILAALAVLFLAGVLGAIAFVMAAGAYTGKAYPVDFAAFWGAARFAIEGRAIEAFDEWALHEYLAIPKENSENIWLWLYPPTWHLVVWPFGYLPFWLAYPLFAVGALVVYIWALAPYARDGKAWPGDLNLVLASPVVIIGTLNGNNGLLTAGVLLFAITALSQGREMRAGLLISILSMKPTLGILLPIALAAGGHWRAFLWATIGMVAMMVVATLVMGIGYWETFLQNSGEVTDLVAKGDYPLQVTVSWFGFVYGIGLGTTLGFWIQGLVTLCFAVMVGWVFARERSWLWKGAILLIITPMATPYAHFYEMGFTLAGTILMVSAGAGRSWLDRSVIAALWVVPVFSLFLRDPPVVAWLAAPLATIALILCLIRMRETWPTAPATS
ncbi:MAG: glycosyltransferase family 87 protein [Pseudomonadota bacterium]